jgi:hypothetical protein
LNEEKTKSDLLCKQKKKGADKRNEPQQGCQWSPLPAWDLLLLLALIPAANLLFLLLFLTREFSGALECFQLDVHPARIVLEALQPESVVLNNANGIEFILNIFEHHS